MTRTISASEIPVEFLGAIRCRIHGNPQCSPSHTISSAYAIRGSEKPVDEGYRGKVSVLLCSQAAVTLYTLSKRSLYRAVSKPITTIWATLRMAMQEV